MGLGSAGAKNAGLLAVQILATSDALLKEKLLEYREQQREAVMEKARKMESEVSDQQE